MTESAEDAESTTEERRDRGEQPAVTITARGAR